MFNNDNRKMERRDFTYYMKVTEAATGNLVGYLADISTGGFKLDSEKELVIGREYRLQIDLTPDIANKTSMLFSAKCMWIQPDNVNPNAFKVGFKITQMAPSDAIIFQRMFEKYALAKPNRTKLGSYRQ